MTINDHKEYLMMIRAGCCCKGKGKWLVRLNVFVYLPEKVNRFLTVQQPKSMSLLKVGMHKPLPSAT